jgi:hypothetical protein
MIWPVVSLPHAKARQRMDQAEQMSASSHQRRSKDASVTTALPSISDVLLSRSKRRSGPIPDVF